MKTSTHTHENLTKHNIKRNHANIDRTEHIDDSVQLIKLLLFSQYRFLIRFTPQYPQLRCLSTIFALAHLLPLSLAHLPQQKTPFKLATLYNNSIAGEHPSFFLEEAIL